MQFNARARYIRYSPYKLRPLADVIRGKNAGYALHLHSNVRFLLRKLLHRLPQTPNSWKMLTLAA